MTPFKTVNVIRECKSLLPAYGLNSEEIQKLYNDECTQEILDIYEKAKFHYLDVRRFDTYRHGKKYTCAEEIASHEPQTVEISVPSNENNKEEAWEDSTTAVCKALLEVFKENRRDWVSGQEKGTGDTNSAGKETFRALLARMHPKGKRCRVKAEAAAWKVPVDNGYTHTGGRKPNP